MAEVRETPDSAGVHIPPPFIYVAAFLLGLLVERWIPTPSLPRDPARAAALVCVLVSLVMAFGALLLFWRHRTTPLPMRPSTTLVTGGPYRVSRNPMYLGLAFLYSAVALWFDHGWPLLFLPIAVFVIQTRVIVREERYLERRFGEEYSAYRRRVRRWL